MVRRAAGEGGQGIATRRADASPARDPSRRPPSVEAVLAAARPSVAGHDRQAITAAARVVVAQERDRLDAGATRRDAAALAADLVATIESWSSGMSGAPVRVLNATGVILHTNLGRAPWPAEAVAAAEAAARGYLLLELDRETGRRGRRYRSAEEHLVALTGAEDALVVTNNAAAVALAVGLAGRRGVAVARGELVEIGGGVRIPEVVRRAGGRLVEVGTTNRTRLADFADALASGRVGMILRVHPSNFRQTGFVEIPEPRALSALARQHGALLVDDLGSGALLDTAAFGLEHEPMPSERLADGADVVTFSGDKLVGGPQAGVVVGSGEAIGRLLRDPLARAMRPDKTILAALTATLALYRAGLASSRIPVWRMVSTTEELLRPRAEAIAGTIGRRVEEVTIGTRAVRSTLGGGSLPGETLPSWAVTVSASRVDGLLTSLRLGTPCVVARVESGSVVLDMRSVDPADDEALAEAVIAAILGHGLDRDDR
ncbi:MAG TPA: L-seryl-tRNA(Sec) selenium transferase [Candidatus Dormibacteraeota bacterium]|nr:L-seryl-tRNA(Sec) selenium transferase [Candidatus Dormibacteraeota bacterium]